MTIDEFIALMPRVGRGGWHLTPNAGALRTGVYGWSQCPVEAVCSATTGYQDTHVFAGWRLGLADDDRKLIESAADNDLHGQRTLDLRERLLRATGMLP